MPQGCGKKNVANKIATNKLPQLKWVMEKVTLKTCAENNKKIILKNYAIQNAKNKQLIINSQIEIIMLFVVTMRELCTTFGHIKL